MMQVADVSTLYVSPVALEPGLVVTSLFASLAAF